MSLLDQLTQLCSIQEINHTSFFGQIEQNQKQKQKSRSYSVTPSKTIKLFDDKQINSVFKSGNKISDIKNLIQPCMLSLFDINKEQQLMKKQKLTKLTKMSYLLKNKLRKINYQFFVKIQKYVESIAKQKEKKKYQNLEKYKQGFGKLNQGINIMNLKYFKNQQIQGINQKQKSIFLERGFYSIKQYTNLKKNIGTINKIVKKLLYKTFVTKIHNFNRLIMKLDLFQDSLKNIIQKKINFYFHEFFIKLKGINKTQIEQITNYYPQIVEYNTSQISTIKHEQNYEFYPRFQEIFIPFIPINIYPNLILNLHRQEQNSKSLIQRQFFNNQEFIKSSQNFYQKTQNIPIQLQYLKSHQEQINLNDCIDNGHLLMNQINRNRTLMSLRKQNQLENLTISKIGSNNHTNNTSFNSSAFTYENFILPQFNNDQSSKRILEEDDSKPSTLRKSVNTTQKTLKNIKKPRSSLIITKRKQSISDVLIGSQKNSFHNSLSNNKSKNHSFNSKKLTVNKDQDKNNKQFLQKMLQELNKKYSQTISSHKKTLQLDKCSNKKQTKKNQTESSNSKISNKKHRSQFLNNNLIIKELRQNNIHLENDLQIQSKSKNLIKNFTKIPENHFKQVTLNQNNNKQSIISNFIEQKKKQQLARSTIQQIKKNLSLKNNNSQKKQYIEICYNQKNNQNRIKIDLTNKSKQKNKQINDQFKKYNQRSNSEFQSKTINVYSILKEQGIKNNRKKLFNQNHEQTFNPLKIHQKVHQNQEQNFITFQNNRSNIICQSQTKAEGQTLQYYTPSYIGLANQNQNSTVINYDSQYRYSLFGQPQTQKQIYPNCSRLSIQSNKNIRDSLDKKRKSFQKSIQEWDDMFQKQKSKFLKRQNTHKSTKLSSLNSSVINQIRAKIQKCILNDKDTNKNQPKPLYIQKSGPTSRKNSGIIILKPNIGKDKQKIQFFK